MLALLISGGLWLHWPHLNTLVWSSDEGIHLSAAYLVAQGKDPYRQVSFSQGPLFLEMVRWPLIWWTEEGNEVTAVRVTLLSFALLLLVAVALIGRDLKNNLAGWAAALSLLAMPSFFYFGRAVMADLPAVALGMWAAWAAIRFLHGGSRRWLVGSTVKETIQLELPPNLALEAYHLSLGMYDPASQERLPVQGDESGENAIIIPLAWDL